jgi:hypothetical protein
MVDAVGGTRLAEHPRSQVRLAAQVGADELDRDHAVDQHVPCPVYDAHSPFADTGLESIPPGDDLAQGRILAPARPRTRPLLRVVRHFPQEATIVRPSTTQLMLRQRVSVGKGLAPRIVPTRGVVAQKTPARTPIRTSVAGDRPYSNSSRRLNTSSTCRSGTLRVNCPPQIPTSDTGGAGVRACRY